MGSAEIEATGELISAETGHKAHCPELPQVGHGKTLWILGDFQHDYKRDYIVNIWDYVRFRGI